MKKKFTMVFPDKTIKSTFIKIRDENFINIISSNPSKVYKNKKKYSRKQKHRRDYE